MSLANRILPALIVVLACGTAVAAEPSLRMTEDGTAFLYRSQPGDVPASVAARFGIRDPDMSAFLTANAISDPTRVAVGHEYLIPNPLAVRATAAEARAATLDVEQRAARDAIRDLEAALATTTARADALERRSARLDRLARLWPWAQLIGIALLVGLAAALWVTYRSVARLGEAEHYARGLSDELEQRRRGALAERQQSGRRILDLEAQVQALEHELAPHRTVHRRPTGTH